jgi:diguanylate cyclase (GGDEF)-like protein
VSTDQIVLLVVGLIVIAAVAVTVAYATAYASRSISAGDTDGRPPDRTDDRARARDIDRGRPVPDGSNMAGRGSTTFISPTSTRQVARVVALLFLAAVAVVVALTRAWPESETATFTLLAAGVLFVVLFMDLIPPSALGRYRRPIEGIGATVYLGLLMLLTGGAASPFLVGFYLVAAGTALSAEGRAPIAVALVGAATIAVVGLLDAIFGSPLAPDTLAWVGINAVSLILLADIASAASRAQRHARDEAVRASRFDALTGLFNRSFFYATMDQEIRRSDRMGRGFTMLMLDLDDLKPVNDTFGHQWGDRLIKAVADTIRRTVRFTDPAARYGGDEFVVLLPETDMDGGYVVAEKLRRDIHALALHAAGREVRSSVSVGLVAYPDDGSTTEQLVAAADVAMYEAKRRGKDRIVGFQDRVEWQASPMEVARSQMLEPVHAGGARTGGDPAPWGAVAGQWSGPPGSRSQVPGGRSGPYAERAEAYQADRPGYGGPPARYPEAGGPSVPGSTTGSADRNDRPSGSGTPAAGPAHGASGAAGGSPLEGASPLEGGSTVDQPWLTSSSDRSWPGAGTSDIEPQDGQPIVVDPSGRLRPATWDQADEDTHRGEDEAPGDRPWFVLPIEPDEPDGSDS